MQHIQTTPDKKHFLTFVTVIAGMMTIFLSAYLYNSHSNIDIPTRPGTPQMPEANKAQSALSPEALQPFKGQWHMHAGVLTIKEDGSAIYIARAYENCGPGVKQPCDTWKGDLIIPGIREDIIINDIKGKTAYGTIISSTDNRKGEQVTMTLQEQDMLLFNDVALCGPDAPVGNCGA